MTDETTTIEISHENWQWLSSLKQRPGDSFNDVLTRLRQTEQAKVPDDDLKTAYKQRTDDLETATAGNEPGEMTADAGETLFGDLDDEEQRGRQDIEPVHVPEDIDLPGSGETFERRRETIGTLVTYLQQEGTATRADFLELVDADTVGYSSADSFWANSIKGRDSLSAIDNVVPPSEGGHTWRYDPEQ